jgi:hypothetical protein
MRRGISRSVAAAALLFALGGEARAQQTSSDVALAVTLIVIDGIAILGGVAAAYANAADLAAGSNSPRGPMGAVECACIGAYCTLMPFSRTSLYGVLPNMGRETAATWAYGFGWTNLIIGGLITAFVLASGIPVPFVWMLPLGAAQLGVGAADIGLGLAADMVGWSAGSGPPPPRYGLETTPRNEPGAGAHPGFALRFDFP